MEFVRGLHNLRPEHRGCAVTIGNFDGVHLGHRAVIDQLTARARSLRVPSVVMLFEPQPQEYFRPDVAPARLTRLREKITTLASLPVDRVLCVRFDQRVANMEPQAFIARILRESLDVRYLIVGADFRFGHNRAGDIETLDRAGREHGFEVATAPTVTMDGERVSSTRVRAALAAGDMKTAEKLLGRAYRMCGRVSHGAQIGRRIGIPTANIELRRRRASVAGIFVVEVTIAKEPRPAVASVGTRPTIGGTRSLLEVHVLDFDREIYGAHVAVDFLHRLRDERRFDSMEEMRAHIVQDIEAARQYFNRRPRIAAGRR
jgi:riboflavin kinase/FMN adenylyltransferase